MYIFESAARPKEHEATSRRASALTPPRQYPPISRMMFADQGHENLLAVQASVPSCRGLTGLARQMCYDLY